MASSQLKSENTLGPGPTAFPFAWSGPAMAGGETVITTLRADASFAVPDAVASEQSPEMLRKLFPANLDLDDSWGIQLGHFTIQRRIGLGGMGSVFLATDEKLRRSVALKILSPPLTADPAAVLRFQNEARAAARLDHDNIARIFFYGEHFGLHFIAYEYIPGYNLRDVIRSKDRLAPAEAVNYAMQLAAALSHTAAAGVIHRDIKPSNVLITPQGRAKLVDLGLARKESADASAELTVAGTTLGTFDYISPEQAKDPRSVDVRSDIYSLGCTLYHMLTGEPPYPEGTVLQKLLDHQGKEPPDPSRKNRRVPPELSAIVRKMMASEPRRRYSSPAKLLSDLLKVARMLGSGAVPIEGQVWLTATRTDRPGWHGNIGWIATAAALLFLVIAMERFPGLFPGLARRMDVRPNNGSGLSTSTPQSPGSKGSTSSDTGGRSGSGSNPGSLHPVEIPRTVNLIPNAGGPAHPGAGALPKFDAGSPQKVFEDLKILSPGDTEFVGPTGPEKNKGNPIADPTGREPLHDPSVVPRPANGSTTTGANPGTGESRPLISIGAKSYASLEAACSEAKEGTTIELRYNGRRSHVETPVRLTNKDNVTIRGAIGFRPMIEFAPADQPVDAESRMVTVTGGSLQLVDVDVMLTVPQRIIADRWAVFSLERPRELQLQNVTVTVINPASQPACVIEQKAAPGQGVGNMGIMKNGAPIEPPRVSIFDCLIRGNCDLILLRDAVPARFQLKDAVVATQGALLHASCQSEMNSAETDRVLLDLDSVHCLTSDGLILTEGVNQLNDHTPPLTVTARDNIFWSAPNKPLVAMMDAGDLMEMQRRFVWSGDRNHYDSLAVFWQLGGRQGPAPSRILNFDGWRGYWGGQEGSGSVNAPVKWRMKPPDGNWAAVDYSGMEIDSSNLTVRVPGATLSKLPPIPNERPVPVVRDDVPGME